MDDPITAALTAPSIPMTGTLDGAAQPVQMPLPPSSEPLTWDEARALSTAAEDAGGNKEDKLFEDAVATVRLQGKASISLLQRRLRIGYTRSARLIEQMEERGIVGPSAPARSSAKCCRRRTARNKNSTSRQSILSEAPRTGEHLAQCSASGREVEGCVCAVVCTSQRQVAGDQGASFLTRCAPGAARRAPLNKPLLHGFHLTL